MSDLLESTVHDTSELYLALILSDHFVLDRRLQLLQLRVGDLGDQTETANICKPCSSFTLPIQSAQSRTAT